jgi:electron transport complex protein RnfD
VAYTLSFSIFNGLYGLNPLYNLITASSLFSMLFLFSDPYSTPKSIRGKIFFGVIIGVANGWIRTGTYYTEAMVFAVLIANLFTPLLDRLFPPAHTP